MELRTVGLSALPTPPLGVSKRGPRQREERWALGPGVLPESRGAPVVRLLRCPVSDPPSGLGWAFSVCFTCLRW